MIRVIIFLLLASVSFGAQPNVIFFLSDDQGAETCVPYGGEWVTPNIDSIASGGMRFLNCHASESCAPSRAMLMTGRYSDLSNRFNPVVQFPTLPSGAMSTDEYTMADMFSGAGYSTCLVGKWNLRFSADANTSANAEIQRTHIEACGFDTNYTFMGNTIEYYGDETTFFGNNGGHVEENYFPYLENVFALDYLDEHYDDSNPFYMQYSFGLVHDPYTVTPDNPTETNETDAVLTVGMYTYMDKMVSNVLARVESLGIADNTIIIYSGDNGTANALTNEFGGVDIAGGKLTSDETATWVPLYFKYPSVVATNSTYAGLTDFADIIVTLADIVGGTIPTDRFIDGKSFYQGLLGNATSHRTDMHRMGFKAARDGFKDESWKYYPNSDELYSITNKPYGDDLITYRKASHKAIIVRLNGLNTNEVTKSVGDTPWGGHSNEVFYAQ